MRRHPLAIVVFALALSATAALAGPFRDAESQMRAAYADYRAALFRTNQNDPAGSRAAIAAFGEKWQQLAADWRRSPPPQYAEDPQLATTLDEVAQVNAEAARLVEAGKVADAHEVLEKIRDAIGALRARNGVVTFSDHMNAYHEQMEKVLLGSYEGYSPAGLLILREDVAVLAYLAEVLTKTRPAAEAAAIDQAIAPVLASVEAVRSALAGGNATAIRNAVKALKPAYSRLFLRFG
jgi:hypothetical protein